MPKAGGKKKWVYATGKKRPYTHLGLWVRETKAQGEDTTYKEKLKFVEAVHPAEEKALGKPYST